MSWLFGSVARKYCEFVTVEEVGVPNNLKNNVT